MTHSNSFFKFWNNGYKGLVPIIPPDAALSPQSTLFKRLEAGKDARGKAVGIKGKDGLWRGYDWLRGPIPDEAQIEAWQAMGAGVGIRTGNGLVALDVDTLDQAIANQAYDLAVTHFGEAPMRVGRAPKFLMLLRVTEPVSYQRVEFAGYKGQTERIELLADDRQFVANGIHPGTRQPYTWPTPLPPITKLATTDSATINAYFRALQAALPQATVSQGAAATIDRSTVNQQHLIGNPERVKAAVRALPNTAELFPTYDDYIRIGAAIKGATQDDPALGLELFLEWSAKYDGNDPETAEADYSRIKAPFEIGASYLYDLADKHSHGAFDKAEAWLQDVIEADDPFSVQEARTKTLDAGPDFEPLKLISPLEWQGKEPKEREWEVEGWIPKGEVTLLYGDGGIGKTLLIHQYATAAAAGMDWLGQPTRKARVLCFFCEDSEDELHRRQRDILAGMMLDYADIDENLRIAPRKFLDNAFAHWDRNTGALRLQNIWIALRDAAVEFKADVVIVDTIADVFSGSEIDRVQVNSFVKACLGRLASEINGTVIALGHPSMAGKSSGSGTSGSTAWSNAARSRLFLRYPKGTEKGNIRELEGMKSNYGPKGNLLKLRWERGAFAVVAGAVAEFPEKSAKGHIPNLEDAVEMAVVSALVLYPEEPLSMSERAANYAPRFLKRAEPGIFEAFQVPEINNAMDRLIRRGTIKATEIGRKANRHALMGYKVMRARDGFMVEGATQEAVTGNVFD